MQILAGQFKGRRLLGPRGRDTTRPITSSVKKSLFGMLGQAVAGATVADLFCGTGTLGLEALSHGAATCAFAEKDRTAVARLRRNIETLDVAERCIVWSGDVSVRLRHRLRGLDQPIDLAFVDPPYAQSRRWSWRQAEREIFAPLAEHLHEQGTVIVRMEAGADLPEVVGTLALRRVRKYGGMVVGLLSRMPDGD